MRHPAKRMVWVGMFVMLGVAACSDSTSPLAGKGQSVSLSFSGVRPPGVSGAMSVQNVLADTFKLGVGTDTLRITSVEIVLRKIELRRVATAVNCDSTADEDACEEFETGSTLVNLPLVAGTSLGVTVPVDSGTYSKVEFKIHKPGNDSVDLAFFAANPGFPTNTSIRVRGTFNGVAFTYTTSLDAEQEYTFNPPLVVDASGSATNLTIRFDLSTWFRNGAAGPLVNPSTANNGQANQSLVENNIKNSIKAFEDHDHDGNEIDG